MQPASLFPKWANGLRTAIAIAAVCGALYAAVIVTFGFSPYATDVGYMPEQPVKYSHALHAGKLGMDCRYCHTTVEHAELAAVPPTQTCMGCHANILPDSDRLGPIRESYASGKPVEWIKVHDLPDYVYFNHSAHVRRGVGCATCHGRIDEMEVVHQVQPLSMSWCLDCHRTPEKYLRPIDQVTNMNYDVQLTEDPLVVGRRLKEEHNINPSTDCSTCHR